MGKQELQGVMSASETRGLKRGIQSDGEGKVVPIQSLTQIIEIGRETKQLEVFSLTLISYITDKQLATYVYSCLFSIVHSRYSIQCI